MTIAAGHELIHHRDRLNKTIGTWVFTKFFYSHFMDEHVMNHHGLRVDAVRTREDGPIKPSPAPILSICAELGADAARSWMIGDHLYDVKTGKAAGTRTVLFVNGDGDPEDTGGADFVIHRLDELPALLKL